MPRISRRFFLTAGAFLAITGGWSSWGLAAELTTVTLRIEGMT